MSQRRYTQVPAGFRSLSVASSIGLAERRQGANTSYGGEAGERKGPIE